MLANYFFILAEQKKSTRASYIDKGFCARGFYV